LLGQKLSQLLGGKSELSTIVVALPRGGVPVAVEIAKEFKSPLTVLVAKKISAPMHPEFAIGAVSSTGSLVLNENTGLPVESLNAQIVSQREKLIAQAQQAELEWLHVMGLKEQLRFEGRRAILVDDGIATGMTAVAAADSLRKMGATELIISAPVIAAQTVDLLLEYCDRVVAVLTPYNLSAVGFFYEDFSQVSDEEVRKDLMSAASRLI